MNDPRNPTDGRPECANPATAPQLVTDNPSAPPIDVPTIMRANGYAEGVAAELERIRVAMRAVIPQCGFPECLRFAALVTDIDGEECRPRCDRHGLRSSVEASYADVAQVLNAALEAT